MMYFVGYNLILMPQQRRCLFVSGVSTPDVILMVSSGRSSAAFENGDRSWQGSLYISVWMETAGKLK
jgi:hypothetical protein